MVTTESPQLRRIALLARGDRLDLVVPKGDVLAHVIAAAGVHLGAGDRVIGPEGTAIDLATAATELREGGLYSVAHLAHASVKPIELAGAQLDRVRALPWALIACALTVVVVGLTSVQEGSRILAAVVLALAAVLTVCTWALRTTEQTRLSGCVAPLLLGAAAGGLSVPVGTDNYLSFAVSMGAAGVTILAAFMMVLARSQRIRAGATPIVVISAGVAALNVMSPMLEWQPAQLALVLSGAAVLALRALPSLLVKVDEGYHIDYGKFMVLRWTVRGKVPQYLPRVQTEQISQIVRNAEARLQTSTVLLSIFAGVGLPAAALPIAGSSLVERIAACVFVVLLVVGLLMTSRRTVSKELRTPPRFAAVLGLVVFTLIFSVGASGSWIWLVAAGLAAVGAVVAVLSVSLAQGNRSLGWSRTGDIFESFAIALVFPAALVAAGTLELLRGVLS